MQNKENAKVNARSPAITCILAWAKLSVIYAIMTSLNKLKLCNY